MSAPVTALVANAGGGTVSTFRIQDGTLTRLAVSEVAQDCGTLAVDTERNLVYVAGKDPFTISTCAYDPATGELEVLDRREVDESITYLTLTPRGDQLLGVSYGGGFGQCWPVEGGRLGEPGNQVQHRNLHSVAVTRDGRFAYMVSLGDDLVARYAITPESGLTEGATFATPEGCGPRHLVLNANETALYVVTEYSGEVLHYRRDVDSGDLTLESQTVVVNQEHGLGHSHFGADPVENHFIWGADLHLSHDEKFLWTSERTESELATVPVGLAGDPQTPTAFISTEKQPRGFGVTPDGSSVLVTGEKSTTVTLYAVQPDGTLVESDRQETGAGANWVRFL